MLDHPDITSLRGSSCDKIPVVFPSLHWSNLNFYLHPWIKIPIFEKSPRIPHINSYYYPRLSLEILNDPPYSPLLVSQFCMATSEPHRSWAAWVPARSQSMNSWRKPYGSMPSVWEGTQNPLDHTPSTSWEGTWIHRETYKLYGVSWTRASPTISDRSIPRALGFARQMYSLHDRCTYKPRKDKQETQKPMLTSLAVLSWAY